MVSWVKRHKFWASVIILYVLGYFLLWFTGSSIAYPLGLYLFVGLVVKLTQYVIRRFRQSSKEAKDA